PPARGRKRHRRFYRTAAKSSAGGDQADRPCNEQRYERSVTGECDGAYERKLRTNATEVQASTADQDAIIERCGRRESPVERPEKANLPARRALVGPGRALAIGAAVSALYLVLFSFPISHNGDLHRVRRHHGSCLDWSRRGRRWGRSHRLRTCPADIFLADPAIWIRL